MSAVKAIEKLTLKLLPTVNSSRLKVGVPVESISFERVHELFDHKVIINTIIIVSFHKMSNMLAGVSFAIELLKLRWLVACWHPQTIDPLRIRLSICVRRLNDTFNLVFNGLLNELFQLIRSDHFVSFWLQLFCSIGRIFLSFM